MWSLSIQGVLATKKMFMRYISHEIRTPMSTMYMGLKLLTRDLSKSKTTEVHLGTVKDVKTSADIALGVLNDMLLYDKIESGIMQLEFSEVRPWSLVKSVMAPFMSQVGYGRFYCLQFTA